jgi:hypothetical protein
MAGAFFLAIVATLYDHIAAVIVLEDSEYIFNATDSKTDNMCSIVSEKRCEYSVFVQVKFVLTLTWGKPGAPESD